MCCLITFSRHLSSSVGYTVFSHLAHFFALILDLNQGSGFDFGGVEPSLGRIFSKFHLNFLQHHKPFQLLLLLFQLQL